MAGRGRGRAWKPPSGAQLLLQKSAQASGLDDRNLRTLQDLTRPTLFPDLMWHSSGKMWKTEEESTSIQQTKRSSSAIYMIRKSREIHLKMQESVYHVRPAQEADVARYRKRPRAPEMPPDKIVLKHVGKSVANPSYIPDELLRPAKPRSVGTKLDGLNSGPGAAGESLEEIAARVKRDMATEGEEDEEGLEEDVGVEEEDEEDEVEDYMVDHYASEDESAGDGDDAEPTY